MAESISSSPCETSPDFDLQAALDAFGGDRELLAIVCQAFVDDEPQLVARLRSAASARDAKALQSAAHALKGSVRFFGQTEVYDVAYALETDARSGNLDRADAAIAQLEVSAARLAAHVAQLVAQNAIAS